jgi:hypothetical protein
MRKNVLSGVLTMLLMFFATVANASPSVLQDRKCKILLYKVMCVLGSQILAVWLLFFTVFFCLFFIFLGSSQLFFVTLHPYNKLI